MVPEVCYDPQFDRSDEELQAFMLFCICAAGKNADNTLRGIKKLMQTWADRYGQDTPFGWVRHSDKDGWLAEDIRRAGLGCFNYRAKYFRSCRAGGIGRLNG